MASNRNLINSWDNAYRNYIERLSDIDKNVGIARSTLYDRYNKDVYEQFTSNLDNLIILENFLRKSNSLVTNAFLKSKNNRTSEKTEDFNQEKMVSNLIKQVKPRERKLLFPDLSGEFSVVNKRTQKQD